MPGCFAVGSLDCELFPDTPAQGPPASLGSPDRVGVKYLRLLYPFWAQELTMRRIFPVLATFCFCVASLAQSNSNVPNDCRIDGSVVDGASGQPLPGSQVFARAIPMARGGIARPASTTTDGSGEFKIDNLAPGRYLVRAIHSGYMDLGRGGSSGAVRTVVLSPGQHLDGFLLTLTPGAIISGHITDDNGKIIGGASLLLLKSTYQDGNQQMQTVSTTSSDENGQYRFGGLLAGKYYLLATPPRQAKTTSDKTYAPLYYPHANDPSGASLLEVTPGQEVGGIDITFSPVHTVTISGQVVDAHTSLPSKDAEVTLLSDDGNTVFPAGDISTDEKGSFKITAVPAGTYILTAQTSSDRDEDISIFGRTTVEVSDANVTGIKLPIGKGMDVTGHIRIEGKPNQDVAKIQASLEPREGSSLVGLMPGVDSARIGADGTYVFRNVPDATYSINFSPLPSGYYLKATNGGEVPETITLGHGHASSIPELTLSQTSASISGSVTNDGQPAAGATVVLLPSSSRQGHSHRYTTSLTDKTGHFTFRDVPPGDYTLIAWEDVAKESLGDPEFLQQYEDRGEAVHVEDSAQNGLQLEAIPASDSGH